jgi:hypothetical protein
VGRHRQRRLPGPVRRQREPPGAAVPNKGNGTFEDIAPAAGVARTAFTKGVAAADYDRDGDVDFYLSNLGGGNFLYRNNGNRTFTEVSDQAGVPGPERGFPTWFFDYDNDGWDDLLVSSYFLSVDETARRYLRRPPNATSMKLYRNLGNGTFADVTAQVGLNRVYMPMGSNFATWTTMAIQTSISGPAARRTLRRWAPCSCTTARGDRSRMSPCRRARVSCTRGTASRSRTSTADGDLDIVFKVGGATPATRTPSVCSPIPGTAATGSASILVGAQTNRAAIGARIAVTVHGHRRRRAHGVSHR